MEDLRGTLVATLGALLTAALLLVMATGVAVLVLPRLGLEMRTVLSDSMEPRLSEGDLLVTWPVRATRIEPGDVILFDDGADHAVAHRVVAVSGAPGARLFETKGDANDASDERLVPQSDVRGRMIFYVPKAGAIAEHLRAPYGSLALIVIPCLALLALDGGSWLRLPARPDAPGTHEAMPTAAITTPIPHEARSPRAWRRVIAGTAVTGIAIAIVGTAAILLAPAGDDNNVSAPQIASVADASAIILQSRVEAIARDPSLAGAPDADLAATLDALRPGAGVDFSTLALVDTRGDVVASAGEALATTTDSAALLRALATNAPASLPMRTVEGLPYVDAAVPLRDAYGDTTGILLARVSASALWRDAISAASDGHAAIVDADGAFFVAPSAGDSAQRALAANADGCAAAPLAIDGAASAWSVIACARDDAFPFDRSGVALLAVALAAIAASALAFAWIFGALPRAIAMPANDAANERLLMLRDHANEF